MVSIAILALMAISCLQGIEANPCPPLGPTLPSSKTPSDSTAVKQAIAKIQEGLANRTSSLKATAISIGVKSIHESVPLFDWHFTPLIADNRSTTIVDIDTVYRGGSITKLFTTLAALQSTQIKGTDPVTKYLPQLKAEAARNKGKLNFVPWDSITIEDLASHVSGLGGDIATDLAVFPGNWAALGLPPVSNSTKPTCSGLGGTKPCTADDLLSGLNKKPLVFLPHTTPVYSNIGLSLLSLVLETATNKTYESILTETILKPLGLANTSIAVPADDAWGFIPKGEVTWGGDLGVFASAGGIYTNTRDLLAFGAAILSSDLGIDTRSWLKPRAFTSSRGYSIGAPWEIWTSSTLLDSGVPVSAYTKSGDLGLYTNVLIVVPDYDLVISILTAGAEAAESSQFPARVISPVIETLIPALEQANKEYADATFAGTYIDDETNSTLTLSVDDGPGLSLTNYTVRGVNVLANIPNYGLSPGPKTFNVSGRLYPTNIREGDQWSWRAVYKNHDEPEIDDELFYPDGGCQTWGLIDRKAYNYLALDDFVVTAAKDGSATSISPRPFGVTLTKIES
ncbi:beta-lactamase [Colletotrichum higginsianum]|uniref:Beta-lactamase n=2 Tax=Colletotrichum higginsianum TaxID=80884 RepID=H1UX48_COLHI|nr:Beta-lactamase [Colletotrichum higginsianum IMI 349063]OBR11218.1 Beta-lactamase [Colletotrichum higginsianum IMI 349063]TIC90965.1 Beta-lactamase-like protein [Colletotrichum higginsianum]CCF32549.1 beta-lactamase [Colletotrichum higginsianum]